MVYFNVGVFFKIKFNIYCIGGLLLCYYKIIFFNLDIEKYFDEYYLDIFNYIILDR